MNLKKTKEDLVHTLEKFLKETPICTLCGSNPAYSPVDLSIDKGSEYITIPRTAKLCTKCLLMKRGVAIDDEGKIIIVN